MEAAEELAGRIGQTAEACEALGVARSTLYRRRQSATSKPKRRPRPHRALDETEREEVLGALHCERFVDKAPAQVWATLLDEGTYLCSIRTMYRILEEHGEVRERRNQRRHPNYTKPELLAEAPNQVWSWDITKLRGPVKWTYYYLYVILDIFSRYVVGWMLAHRESAALAQRLIAESCRKQDIEPDQLTVHADRGSSMRSKSVAFLLADLGVTKTHSRPYVSNDNPYSESQFKTLKYCPQFPSRFGSIQDSRLFCCGFFDYYNFYHKHSGVVSSSPRGSRMFWRISHARELGDDLAGECQPEIRVLKVESLRIERLLSRELLTDLLARRERVVLIRPIVVGGLARKPRRVREESTHRDRRRIVVALLDVEPGEDDRTDLTAVQHGCAHPASDPSLEEPSE